MRLKHLLFLSALSVSTVGWANDPRQEFCSRTWADFQQLLQNRDNQIAFNNPPGDLNMGLCLWHSRFQRAAAYMSVYRPEEPKPSRAEAHRLMERIYGKDRVVEIPGYNNLREFTRDYKKELTALLDEKQKRDGLFRFTWINTFRGEKSTTAEKLAAKMDALYVEVTQKQRITYQKLKYSDWDIHAWLVIAMTKTAEGYDLQIVESNQAGKVVNVRYRYGDHSLSVGYMSFVSYTEKQDDFVKIAARVNDYCGTDHLKP